MKYALNLAEDGRVLSVTYADFSGAGQPVVEELPGGDCYDYRYVEGEYVYDPLPELDDPEEKPTFGERLQELEEAIELLLSGVTE